MNIKKNFLKLVLFTTIIGFSSCETLDLDQTENPSKLSQDFLDPVYTFNFVQLELPKFVSSANAFTQRVTRQMAMTGGNTYDNAFAPVNFDTNWSQAYLILNAVKLMEPKALEQKRYSQLGGAKIIRCYVLATLVDLYGDVPYSEALLGNDNITPKYDTGASVYKGVLAELDEAIAILNYADDTPGDIQDLYYEKDKNKWITLAKTLKLKMYVTARQAGTDLGTDTSVQVAGLISGGDLIDNADGSEDFAYRYGNSRFTPNTRHPLYNDQYESGGGAYIANYYMWAMTTEKGFSANYAFPANTLNDPRLHYYFYKQAPDPSDYNTNTFVLPGRSRPAHYNNLQYASKYNSTVLTPYVVSNWTSGANVPENGFWGRDHGDFSGIPQDADLRTVGGIYPIGGVGFVNPTTVQTGGDKGLQGAGIMPILLCSWVHFLKAEAMLTMSVPGDAKSEFVAGINTSINKVTTYGNDQEAYPVLTTAQTNFVNYNKTAYPAFMETKYDEAASNQSKLEVVIKEYYLAAWGNGIETYNNYRRTGFPSNFQPTLQPAPGPYFNKALYAQSAINNNPNAPANDRTKRVFWDKANITLQ